MAGKFVALIRRDFAIWTRNPTLFIGFLVGPALWIFVFGKALNSAFFTGGRNISTLQGAPDYFNFLASAMIVVVPMTFAGRAGASIFADRLTGYLDRLKVTPMPRETIVLSKVVASMVLGVFQSAVILTVSAVFGLQISAVPITALVILVASVFLLAFGFSSVFSIVSMRITRWPTQQMVTTFLATPIMFLSNAFYPSASIPGWIRDLTFLNPLSYGISVSRLVLFHKGPSLASGVATDFFALLVFAAVSSVALVVATRKLL
jgi:ABC-2 type transport system permease protein